MEYLIEDIVFYLIEFLNVTDYYSLKSTNKHFYNIVPIDKRECLLKRWQSFSKKFKVFTTWDIDSVMSIKDHYQSSFYVHDWGLLFQCCYQNQINDNCNFYNLYVFVITLVKKCFQLFWVPVQTKVQKTDFHFCYIDNHLTINNSEIKFGIKFKDNEFETSKTSYDYISHHDWDWAEYQDYKLWISKNLLTLYRLNNLFYALEKMIHATRDKYIILTQVDRFVVLHVLDSPHYDIFDFSTAKLSSLNLDTESSETLRKLSFCHRTFFDICKNVRFIYLKKSGMLAFFSFNKCTLFQHDDSKWVVYRQFLHRSSATLFGFCEEEQRMIKFF